MGWGDYGSNRSINKESDDWTDEKKDEKTDDKVRLKMPAASLFKFEAVL